MTSFSSDVSYHTLYQWIIVRYITVCYRWLYRRSVLEYAIYFIEWSEKMNISFVSKPLMKYAFFASLDEINGIFIPKIWISSMFSENFKISICFCLRLRFACDLDIFSPQIAGNAFRPIWPMPDENLSIRQSCHIFTQSPIQSISDDWLTSKKEGW